MASGELVSCSVCGREVKTRGLLGHMRLAHPGAIATTTQPPPRDSAQDTLNSLSGPAQVNTQDRPKSLSGPAQVSSPTEGPKKTPARKAQENPSEEGPEALGIQEPPETGLAQGLEEEEQMAEAVPVELLEYRCLTCEEAAPATDREYMLLLKHKCSRPLVRLVRTDTGEALASSPQQARKLGILPEKGVVSQPQVSGDGLFRYTVSLPFDAMTMFNVAKATGHESPDTTFDQWLWDNCRARFRRDYKVQLVLAPIEEVER